MPQDMHFPMTDISYTVGILGAGRIASGFDTPDSRQVLTHAHAVTRHSRLTLVALTDIDATKGVEEARKWGTEFVPAAEQLLSEVSPDILVIATPDATHADILIQALSHRPRLVILEKPAIIDLADAARVEEAVRASGIPVIVNFRRRFDDTVVRLAEELREGKHGSVLSAGALYSKGILHTGSHMLDLARLLFGELVTSVPLSRLADWEGEPTVSGFASFERCPQFSLMGGDERAYSIFELEIRTEKRRFRFLDEGMMLATEEVIPDPLYAGFRILGPARTEPTGLVHSMERLMEHSVRVLDGNEEPRSTLTDALRTDAACRTFL